MFWPGVIPVPSYPSSCPEATLCVLRSCRKAGFLFEAHLSDCGRSPYRDQHPRKRLLGPPVLLAVINMRQHVSYPLRPCNQGEVGGGKNPSKPFRDLCLKLFSFVRGENNQMFLKVNPVNQGRCVGASRSLWQLGWVWFCTHSWLCTPTHTHPATSL